MGFFQVESSDLIAYGLIPEFVGRFPILVNLSALTEEQLVQVGFYLLNDINCSILFLSLNFVFSFCNMSCVMQC